MSFIRTGLLSNSAAKLVKRVSNNHTLNYHSVNHYIPFQVRKKTKRSEEYRFKSVKSECRVGKLNLSYRAYSKGKVIFYFESFANIKTARAPQDVALVC